MISMLHCFPAYWTTTPGKFIIDTRRWNPRHPLGASDRCMIGVRQSRQPQTPTPSRRCPGRVAQSMARRVIGGQAKTIAAHTKMAAHLG